MTLSKKDTQLLKLLLQSTENSLMRACEYLLTEKYGKHNVFAKKDFIYATGDIPILLVAHLDTVLDKAPIIFTAENNNIWYGKKGLGADDRAGLFAILKIIQSNRRPSILFTTGEEIGGIGAMTFVKEFPEPPVPTKYIIEIDRRGKGQAVFYDCGNSKFMSYVESFGFKTHKGIFSDISFICPHWDVAGVNLSAGYSNEHTHFESLNIEHLFYTIERVNKMLDDANNASMYAFEGYDEQLRMLYSQCQVCGKIVPLFSTTNVQGTNTCIECVSTYVEWCSNCGKPHFITSEEELLSEEKLCEECANELRKNSATI